MCLNKRRKFSFANKVSDDRWTFFSISINGIKEKRTFFLRKKGRKADWNYRLTDGSQGKGAPVKTVNVLSSKRSIPRSVKIIDPIVWAESDDVTDGEVEACVPVDEDKDGEDHLRNTKIERGR